MSFINTRAAEIGVKIVYFGPSLAGKSTNVRAVHRKTRPELRGRLDDAAGGALAFDFAPDTIPRIDGRYRVRLHLSTVPGDASIATMRLLLKGVDAAVFVADTQEAGGELVRFHDNVESMELMLSLLDDLRIDSAVMPLVIQHNKRDLVEHTPNLHDSLPPDLRPVVFSPLDALAEAINPHDVPTVPAIASAGVGVLDTLRTLVRYLLEPLRHKYESTSLDASSSGRFT